jgi:dihydroneopterin aldolase
MDIISIKALKLTTKIGVYPFEREIDQTLLVHAEFATQAALIAETDDLNHAIDYDALSKTMKQFARDSHYKLIETFAEKLSQTCFAQFPITWLKLDIQKIGAIQGAQGVSITIQRQRS